MMTPSLDYSGARLSLIRAWGLTVFGGVAIVAGIFEEQAAWVMTGFAVLGTEPQIRSAAGKAINGA